MSPGNWSISLSSPLAPGERVEFGVEDSILELSVHVIVRQDLARDQLGQRLVRVEAVDQGGVLPLL